MSRLMRRPRLLPVSVFLLGALLAGSGVVVAATVVKSGKAVTAMKVVTETAEFSFLTQAGVDSAWTDVPGASLSITVPSDQRALLLITFTAQGTCADGDGSGRCTIRTIVDGNVASPGAYTFQSASSRYGVVNSVQFVHGPLTAGMHTVKVQARIEGATGGSCPGCSAAFFLTERLLSVLRSKV